jgi:hypothetical protein
VTLAVSGALATGLRLRAAEPPARHDFDLPAGDAELALRKFADQSGRQILFPTDLVKDVRTNPVRGRFPDREALDRLLAGTLLFATQDERTGAFALGRVADQSQHAVSLPPYVVEDSQLPPWRYAKIAGFEIITRCSDTATSDLIEDNYRLLELLDELLLPKRLQVKLDVPTSYVIHNDATQPAASREFITELQRRETKQAVEKGASSPAPVSIRALPNYRCWDVDSLAIFFLLDEVAYYKGRQTLSPGYVRYLLENRTPSLPPWFIEGMMEFYKTADLGTAAVNARFSFVASSAAPSSGIADAGVAVRPAVWVSKDQTDAIRGGTLDPRTISAPAPAAIFADLPPDPRNEAALRRWRSYAALFVRWALDDPTQARKQSLWTFAERTSVQPATEAMFRELFGMHYRDLDRHLRHYLRDAVKTPFNLRPAGPSPVPSLNLREATEAEVSRVKGAFDRLEIAYVKELFPEHTARYVSQARRTLRRAYDHGDRDPRLLALLGLCECDAGDDAAARPFLAAAVQAGVVRPRAYFEFARIRFEELRASDPAGKLSPALAADLIEPLVTVRHQSPSLPEVYELIAMVWLCTEGPLSRGQLALLDEGVHLFPRRLRLIYPAALLNVQHGYAPEARSLIERGLTVAADPADEARLRKLRSALPADPAPADAPAPAR